MKRIYSLLVVLFVSVAVSAQVTFSKDTAIVGLKNGHESTSHILISNNSGAPVQISWIALTNTLNNNMSLQFCDCNTCYTNMFGPLPGSATCSNTLGDGFTLDLKVIIDPLSETVTEDYFILEIYNETDNIKDTIVFKTAFDATVGLNQIAEEKATISFYPNPAENSTFIEVNTSENEVATVTISNILGAEVMNVYVPTDGQSTEIDLFGLDKGYYFCKVQANGIILDTQKLVVK